VTGGSGSPGDETIQNAHAHKKAERSAQAERSGKGTVRGLLRLRQSTRTHAEEGQAERSGQAETSGKGGVGVSPDCDFKNRPCAKKKIAASTPSAAKEGALRLEQEAMRIQSKNKYRET
jgi:hypothetical protein